MCPLGWTVSKAGLASVIDRHRSADAAEVVCRLFVVLVPHRRRHPQVVGHLGVIVGLLLVALPPQLQQLAAGLTQLTEDRPE